MLGMRIALDWLTEEHESACGDAISMDFYAALEDEDLDRIEQDPVEMFELTEALAEEWLLAEGRLSLGSNGDAVTIRALDVVLGEGGPALTAEQRAHLNELGRQFTGMYEV